MPVQIKSRTRTLSRSPNCVHFQIRKATFAQMPGTVVIGILFDWEKLEPRCMWLLPSEVVVKKARRQGKNYVLRPSIAPTSKDQWRPYRFDDFEQLTKRLVQLLEGRPR